MSYTGGSNSYYMTYVEEPTTLEEPYYAECNDLIEALDMTPAEANIFKAIWRIAAYRQGLHDKTSPVYDAQKIQFFAERVMVRARQEERE